MTYRIIITLITIFLSSSAFAISESQFTQMKERWESRYGYSHPFRVFEKLALKKERFKKLDLKLGGCRKKWYGYKCNKGIKLNNKKQITSMKYCGPNPLPIHIRQQMTDKIGYAKYFAFLQFMEDTWNSNTRHMTYKLSDSRVCVTGSF